MYNNYCEIDCWNDVGMTMGLVALKFNSFRLKKKKKKNRMFVRCPTYLHLHLYPCTLPTALVSRSFGLRSSYEIDILDTDQRPGTTSSTDLQYMYPVREDTAATAPY